MNSKKIIASTLALSIVASLTACGTGSNDTNGDSNEPKESITLVEDTGTTAATEAQTAADEEQIELDTTPITFEFFTADAQEDMGFADPVAKKITELTGVTLKITHPVGGDQNAVPLMIASGSYPDLIYAKGDTGAMIEAEALLPLDDYIESAGPNIRALYGDQLKRLKYDDGKIYTAGTYGVGSAAWKTDGIMQIQHAALKEAGYPILNTLEKYEECIRSYKDKYPQIDGRDTIGLMLCGGDQLRWLVTIGNIGGYALGYPDDGQFFVDDSTGTATYKFSDPDIKTYFKWLNKLYNDGLLDPESFTQKYDNYIAKIAKGNVVGLADAEWDIQNAVAALKYDEKYERTYAPMPVTVSEDIAAPSLKDYGFGGGWGVAITESCKDPDRAFQFLDWWCTDEAQVLVNWGIEGVNYEYDENGTRFIPADELERRNTDQNHGKTTGVGIYAYPFPQRGDGVKDSTGNYYTTNNPQKIIDSFSDVEKETLAAYKVDLFVDLFPSRESLGVSRHGQIWQYNIPDDSEAGIIQKSLDTYTQTEVTKAIIAKPEEFDAKWDEIVKFLEDNQVDRLNEIVSDMTKEKINAWY